MKLGFVIATAATLATCAAPPAMAATITSDRACYREGEEARFLGAGFQPGQPVAVSMDGRQIATDPADAAGNLAGALTLAGIPRSEQVRALSMTQATNPAVTATRTFKQTKVYVVTKPAKFRPGRRLRIRAGGFYDAGRTLYAHVRGPQRRNLRIGRVAGDCGTVSATQKVLLKRRDKAGIYIVQFDTARTFLGLRTKLQVRRAYEIKRIFRFSRSSPFAAPILGGGPRWVPEN